MAKYNVVGLGTAGSAIADKFKKYPQYRVYKIGTDVEKDKYSYKLSYHKELEDYEKNPPKLKTFFRLVTGDVLFIVGGSGISSTAALVILEQLKDCNVSVMYVKPDTEMFNEQQERIHNLVYHVLQEYTRSGIFEQMYIIDNMSVENVLGEVPIKEYYDRINEMTASTLHMIHVWRNTESIIDNLSFHSDISRLVTIGVVDIKTGDEQLFFPMSSVREKEYYYAIDDKDVKGNNSLFKDIREQIKTKKKGDMKVSYGVYSTDYEENFAFVVVRSSIIQD